MDSNANPSSSTTTIDCLPPPYSISDTHEDTNAFRQYRARRPNRSESMEYIISSTVDDPHRLQGKLCCDWSMCQMCLTGFLLFKRVLVMLIASIVCCTIISVALGVAQTPKNNFITLSLMFAGLGLLLVIVVMVGWRCTPPDHEPCHLLFGLGTYSMVNRNSTGDRGGGRRLYWIGGRLFPEFCYRRPPPSYTASMNEYESALTALRNEGLIPQTPPPQYKVHASIRRPTVQIVYPLNPNNPHAMPPTYQETTSSVSTTPSTSSTSESATTISSMPSSAHEIGIENPVFVDDLEEIIISQATANCAINMETDQDHEKEDNSDDNRLQHLPENQSNQTASIISFHSSQGQITHL